MGILQVTLVKWWMAHYGSNTAKRHYMFANNPVVAKLDRGTLVGWKRVAEDKQTAVRYHDSSGKLRYKGTSNLKKTQILASKSGCPKESDTSEIERMVVLKLTTCGGPQMCKTVVPFWDYLE